MENIYEKLRARLDDLATGYLQKPLTQDQLRSKLLELVHPLLTVQTTEE